MNDEDRETNEERTSSDGEAGHCGESRTASFIDGAVYIREPSGPPSKREGV